MIYRVRHQTIYDYVQPVSVSHHVVRLTPRDLPGQRCRTSELSVWPVPPFHATTHTDYFVRLCDVDPSGVSRNISDGLVRLVPTSWDWGKDGVATVEVPLWPAAHVFRRGHRLRVQVSSGAHPRFARNLGGGEPLATAVTMHVADQEVWHDPDHRSAIVLPLRETG